MFTRLWTSTPIEKSTIVDVNSNTLNVIVNDVETVLEVGAVGYETRIIQHESRLVEELNRLFSENSINITCKIGVIANGNVKSAHVVFEHGEEDVVSYSGNFSDTFLGEVLVFEEENV